MKKLITTLTLNVLIYIVPLAGAPNLILNFKTIICFIAATILFMSQPAMSLREAKEKRSTDKNSLFAILIAAMLGQIVSIVEWAYFNEAPQTIRSMTVAGVGLFMMIVGISFRLWSIRTLGKFFTATVQIKNEHRVVNAGPYEIVRHPSYLGSLIAISGSAIFLEAPVGAVVAMVAMVVAYKMRIDAEEIALVSALGGEYRVYQQQTSRLLPGIW